MQGKSSVINTFVALLLFSSSCHNAHLLEASSLAVQQTFLSSLLSHLNPFWHTVSAVTAQIHLFIAYNDTYKPVRLSDIWKVSYSLALGNNVYFIQHNDSIVKNTTL